MIKSMTGYGRAQKTFKTRDITVEIKSVNHRFFDCSIRTHRIYGYIEEPIKALIKKSITRGKIEVNVNIKTAADENDAACVSINNQLAHGYINSLKELAKEYGLKDDLSLSTIAMYKDIFEVEEAQEDEDEITNCVLECVNDAVLNFIDMRSIEGEKLKTDILSCLDNITNAVFKIEKLNEQCVNSYRDRLYSKVKEVLDNYGIDSKVDEGRIITEVAIYSDKVANAEETVRLLSHIDQLKNMLETSQPVGKKIDFLIQEMNREINTIGSKANELCISQTVVDVKSEIEKIREQVQNIE